MEDLYLCGWRLRSDVPLPSLPVWALDPNAPVDISLTLGEVPPPSSDTVLISDSVSVTPDGVALLQMGDVGCFRVAEGRAVTMDLVATHTAGALQTAILGTVLGVLCYQRGLLPLHASAVMIDGYAVALGGRRGAGKSTLAAMLARRGHVLLSDDIVPYLVERTHTLLLPSSRHSRLRGDALPVLGGNLEGLVIANAAPKPKYHVSAPIKSVIGAVPLSMLVYLIREETGGIEKPRLLDGVERLRAIAQCFYRRELAACYAKSARLAEGASLPSVRVLEFRRKRSFEKIEQACDLIESIATSSFA
jgi:hypothetical protein